MAELTESQNVQSLLRVCKEANSIDGDVAEIGMHTGEVTLKIAKAMPLKMVYGYDTFEGIGDLTDGKDSEGAYRHGKFKCSLSDVNKDLLRMGNVRIVKGRFPECVTEDRKYAFVYLDVDLYQDTLNSLNYLKNRMSDGGMIVVDDYSSKHWRGVEAAVNEFLYNCDSFSFKKTQNTQCVLTKVGHNVVN